MSFRRRTNAVDEASAAMGDGLGRVAIPFWSGMVEPPSEEAVLGAGESGEAFEVSEYNSTIPSLRSSEVAKVLRKFQGSSHSVYPIDAAGEALKTGSLELSLCSFERVTDGSSSSGSPHRITPGAHKESRRPTHLTTFGPPQPAMPSSVTASSSSRAALANAHRSLSVMDKMRIGKSSRQPMEQNQRSKSVVEKIVGRALSSVRDEAEGTSNRIPGTEGIVPLSRPPGPGNPSPPRFVVRPPRIMYTRATPSQWSLELVVLLFNGARREIPDLYDMVRAMQYRLSRLSGRDVDFFYRWWNDFVVYVIEVFRITEEVYFPWLESLVDVGTGEFERHVRVKKMNEIAKQSEVVDAHRSGLLKRSPESFASLVQSIDEFVISLMDYCLRLETWVGSFALEGETINNSVAWLYSCFQNHLFQHQLATVILPAALRWMDVSEIQQWIDAHIRNRWRRFRFSAWQRNFERNHLAIIDHFVP